MNDYDTMRDEPAGAVSWYVGQARALAAGLAHPIRWAHLLLDDSGPRDRRVRRP